LNATSQGIVTLKLL